MELTANIITVRTIVMRPSGAATKHMGRILRSGDKAAPRTRNSQRT